MPNSCRKLRCEPDPLHEAQDVPDFLIRDIDAKLAERIKTMARDRGWPINDVILHLLKQSLGLVEPDPPKVPGDIARLTGAYQAPESDAFLEALKALESLPDDAPSYMLNPRSDS